MRPRLLVCLALAFALPSALAQDEEDANDGGRPQIFVDSDTVAMHLARARRLEQDQDWRSLFRLFQDLLDKQADHVWEVEPGRFVGIREEIHRRLRAYPPEAMQMYREMQEPEAAVLWAKFQEKPDDAVLSQLADRYSLTHFGEDAARLLAMRCHERGDGVRAIVLWSRLVAERSGTPAERARLVLRIAQAAQRAGLAERLAWASSQATPELASVMVSVNGQEVPLSEAVSRLQAALPPRAGAALTDWPSPGGSPANDRVGTGDALAQVVAWSFPKEDGSQVESQVLPANIAFSPAVVGGILYFSDGQTVIALELATGKPIWKSVSARMETGREFLSHAARFAGAPVETVLGCTVYNGVVYVNLVTPGDMNSGARSVSYIAAYDALNGKVKFHPQKEGIPADGVICCPPLVRDDRIFAPIVRPGAEPSVYLGCWSATTGAPLWPKPAFLCGTLRYTMNEYREATPCPAAGMAAGGGRIYVQTNLGGIAAVNESNGEIAWIIDTYRLMKRPPKLRGARAAEVMNLPVLLGDTLWCVPRESELVLSLDTATGALRNEPRQADGAHTLMGLIGGRLVAIAERRNQQYLLSIPLDPGQKEERSIPMSPPLAGRGFLTEKIAYVPGTADLHRFDTKTWRLTYKEPWTPKGSGGHIVVSGDMIISIGKRIEAFCSQESYSARFRDRYEALLPDDWIERGLKFRKSGLYLDAMTDLEYALTLSRLPGTRLETAIAAEARAHLATLYLDWGRKAEADGNLPLAAGAYAWSAARQDDPARRVEALLALASIHEKQGRWGCLVESLARVLVEGPDGMTTPEARYRVRTRDSIARRLAALREKEGDAPFAGLGKEATEAVRAAVARAAAIDANDADPLPEAVEPPVPSPPSEAGMVQLPAGTIDDESEDSAIPAVTPIRLDGGLREPLELRNFGGHVEARRPGSDEVVWTVPDNRGWLGIVMDDDNLEKAVFLTKVISGEPADKAGLKVGDQVAAVDGVLVTDSDHLIQLIASRPEQEAVFTISREHTEVDIRMRTGMRGLKRGERVEQAVATPSGRLLLRRARRVQAVDARSGAVLWAYPLPEHDDGAPGRVAGIEGVCAAMGRAFVAGTTGERTEANDFWARIACLDEATGTLLWTRDMQGRTDEVLAIGRGCIGVVGANGEVTVLDARTGARMGEPIAVLGRTHGGLAAAAWGGLLYIVTPSGTLKALDPAGAGERWSVKLSAFGEGTLCDFAVEEGIVAVVRTGQGIEAYDAKTGERCGGSKSGGEGGIAAIEVGPGPLVLALGPAADGWRLSALDLARGAEAGWHLQLSGVQEAVFAHVQEDRVFVRATLIADEERKDAPAQVLYAVDRASGARVWEHAIPEGKQPPRISAQGGRLCISVDDKMFLFGK